MFGYITIHKPELKMKDYNKYRAYYCGLCRQLKMQHGFKGQFTLSYDMTFLMILLTGLYEPEEVTETFRCPAHPGTKEQRILNIFGKYCADMNLLLTYFNLLDNWKDEKKLVSLTGARLLAGQVKKIKKEYPRQTKAVVTYLKKLEQCETTVESNLDMAAGYTGEMLGELFVFKEDEWADTLRKIGFFLGKFIYLMDAYEDMEKDDKKKSYNPLLLYLNQKKKDNYTMDAEEELESDMQRILKLMMAECSGAFERLPILYNAEILRNILYAGVWTKFDIVHSKRGKQEKNNVRPI
ncbi:hypothetical protein acsn021_35830 [Anaerocolumna cellulosilytica]|uniref:Uncharacterized protein n=1 Tax=Anaerocolumna cellulosilytica TaxID=433286 RepID=A0A6S6QZD4_9FIRM|nr:DUF5685 family protein [Anaerocolumna cellulosilytica]MBB5195481.1 hypothetical protein [Anaerocolumna cellulosilytica]BCJ96014.1 hypothetical protein acsn021_35830 [Anaerocolumna cellulosilytica]